MWEERDHVNYISVIIITLNIHELENDDNVGTTSKTNGKQHRRSYPTSLIYSLGVKFSCCQLVQLFSFCVSAFFLASADLVTLWAISSTSFFAISSLELVLDAFWAGRAAAGSYCFWALATGAMLTGSRAVTFTVDGFSVPSSKRDLWSLSSWATGGVTWVRWSTSVSGFSFPIPAGALWAYSA